MLARQTVRCVNRQLARVPPAANFSAMSVTEAFAVEAKRLDLRHDPKQHRAVAALQVPPTPAAASLLSVLPVAVCAYPHALDSDRYMRLAALQEVHSSLENYTLPSYPSWADPSGNAMQRKLWEKIYKKEVPKGLYLWGGVGIGKTMLVRGTITLYPHPCQHALTVPSFVHPHARWTSS
jgi:predicted ATPase